jgi:CRP-like cAMP-binding protein
MDAERLRKLPLFADLPDDQLRQVALWTDEIDVPAGKHLVEQGSFPHEFIVIEQGTAEVTRNGEHIADLGPGDFFGEMALHEDHRRMATVTATSDLTAVVMFQREFRIMDEHMPQVCRKIHAEMDRRRRENEARGIGTQPS